MRGKWQLKKFYKKLILLSVLGLFVVGLVSVVKYYSIPKIDKILETGDYSYLPKEAKNYIKEVYEKTGNIILTEKNKEENVPYLNPSYVNYLSLEEEKKKNVDLIPDIYVLDYVYTNAADLGTEKLPASYDLRNIDGKSFITPLKDQGDLGLCWAVSMVEQAESYLMVKNNEPYNNSTQKFSIRQLDYATSTNGIKGYNNKYGVRELGSGGAFIIATGVLSDGLTLADETFLPYSHDLTQKDLHEVLNFSNSNYEVNSTMRVPNIDYTMIVDPSYSYENCLNEDDFEACYNSYENELYDLYISNIKKGIIEYGGGVIETIAPTSACSFNNNDGYYVTENLNMCYSSEFGHAMHVIGWDDNYEYSYCEEENEINSTVDGTCKSGTLQEGKGAFLLRNSWGDIQSGYEYAYQTYDSFISGVAPRVSFITDLSKNENRTWDNYYSSPEDMDYNVYLDKTISKKFSKEGFGAEKLEKIKFSTMAHNGVFEIFINTNGKSYSFDNFNTEFPGLYTLDLTNENIVLDGSDFEILITSDNEYLLDNSISAYTSNVDDEPIIKTEDIVIDTRDFTVYSETRNINSNEKIGYVLYDEDGEIVDSLVVENNIVAANNVNSNITIVKKLSNGDYTLKTKYNDYVFESKLTLNKSLVYDGTGTIDDPYLVYNEEGLRLISDDLTAYYRLESDINLTSEWIPLGTEETPFTGGFDGNGHKITGLVVSNEDNSFGGLFGYVKNSNSNMFYITNLTIENANVSASGNVGTLIGEMKTIRGNSAIIDSIYIIGGNIFGNTVGSLIGEISGSADSGTIVVNNIFTSATLNSSDYSGVVGSNGCYEGMIQFSNIQNIGITNAIADKTEYKHTTFSGSNAIDSYNIENFIITGFTNVEAVYYNPVVAGKNIEGKNGYFFNKGYSYWDQADSSKGIYGVSSILSIKDENNYRLWPDFDRYWTIENVDGISRIPVLKGVNFEYTSVSDVNIGVGETVSLLDYINPYTDGSRIDYVVKDEEDKVKVVLDYNKDTYATDIKVTGLEVGTTTLHIVSEYDGYEGDINITVTGNPTVYYNSNNGQNAVAKQVVDANTSFRIRTNSFTKKGYIFDSWNTKADGSGKSYNANELVNGISESIDLYAQWVPINYKIIFNSNDENDDVFEQIFKYDESQKLAKNKFSRKGYEFVRWNSRKDGTGTNYEDEQAILNLTTEEESFNLYARWSPIPYYVRFDANGGEGTMGMIATTYDCNITLFENKYIKENYVFVEWNTKADGSGIGYTEKQVVKNLTTTKNTTVTLYAIWKEEFEYIINEYTVDKENKYIDMIGVKTTLESYSKNIVLGPGFTFNVDLGNKDYIFTGSKTKIYKDSTLFIEYTNIVRGDVNGDGNINYLDYVNVYNHIQKIKNPDSTKKELRNEYLVSADMSGEGNVNYLDYVKIYNKIKELKGEE